MPRLPQIVQNQPLQGSGLSIGSAMAPAEAAARLGQDATNIGLELAHRQVQLQRSQRVMEKTALAVEGAAKLYDKLINDPSIPDNQLASKVQEGFKILHDNIGKDIKDSQVRELYDQNFQGLASQHIVSATRLQRERINSSAKAGLYDSLHILVGRAMDATHQEQDFLVGQIHANINGSIASKLITPEEGDKLLDAHLKEISTAKTIKAIREGPHQALADINADKFPDLTPVEKQFYLTQAQGQADALDAHIVALQEKGQAQAEKEYKVAQENAQTNITDRALHGMATFADVEEWKQAWHPTHDDYVQVFNAVKAGPDLFDNKVLEDRTLAVHMNPSLALKKQLATDFGIDHTLNKAQYEHLDLTLREALNHQGDEGKASLMRRHTEAKDQIARAFGLSGLDLTLSNVTDEVKQPLALALEALDQGSSAYNGMSDPLSIAPQIIKTYLPLAKSAFTARIKADVDLVPSQYARKNDKGQIDIGASVNAIGPFERAQARGMTREQYDSAIRSLKDIQFFGDAINHLNQAATEDLGRK